MDFQHTFVPPIGRGKGLGKILCDSAFEYAEEVGLDICPSCSYVSDNYIKKVEFPESITIVNNDGTPFEYIKK